jgi:ParB family transcriptional regulator, chromosome partitioning protein
MSDRTKAADAAKNIVLVPLDKLKKSPKNVRKIPHTKADIEAFAASIAALGMLQSPVIEPENARGKPTGFYLVNAGEGRRLAQVLRAKRKEIKPDAPIRCLLDTEHNATEISLAENAIRSDMHPADQFEAFAKLHGEDGLSAEDIAARFGVTATVVKQRLKLGAVSPKLMTLYRKGEMNLDQLSAFAITDDHERQERVWNDLPPYNRHRGAIIDALSEGQVLSDDRRARFVGAKAYEAAGGTIIRDLFDPEGGGFLADADLLNRLAQEKLQVEADKVAAEGWRWVACALEFDHEAAAGMRRVFAKPVKLSASQKKQLRKLQVRYDALCDKYPNGDPSEADAGKLARIEAAIDALQKEEYRKQDLTLAGAFVMLGHDGAARVERGYVRPEDEPAPKTKPNGKDKAEAKSGPAPLSEKLVAELTAYRTSALRNELAQHPETALRALLHALTLSVFYSSRDQSCVEITARRAWLSGHAPNIDDGPSERQIAERHAAWAKRLPEEPDTLWTFLQGLSEAERLALLAHCVALSVNAVQPHGSRPTEATADADRLAREVRLDMSAYWQPRPENYLMRVSKERIVEALREGTTSDADAISRLKKPAMAEAAAAALAGKGWLPALLRVPQHPGV